MNRMRPKLLSMLVALTFVAACTKKDEQPPAASAPVPQQKPAPAAAGDTAAAQANEEAAPQEDAEKSACSYITEAEATEALGVPTKHKDEGSPESCDLAPAAGSGPEISISVVRENQEKVFGDYSQKGEKVEALGDEAAWRKDLNGLAVRKGDVVFLLTFLDLSGKAEPRSATVNVARKLVD